MKNHPKINIGIGCVIVDKQNQILLINRRTDANMWTIPSGYIDTDENILETISREMREELNIIIIPRGIIALRQRLTSQEGNNLWVIFKATYKTGDLKPDGNEIGKAIFIPLSRANKMRTTPVTKHIIKLLIGSKFNLLPLQKKLSNKDYLFFA
jgi:ADP-ribose pyrophosphatase YjhB (NUDIX family)